MGRGGERKGAGRPAGKPITKASIYVEDRELLNNYAHSFNLSVNEFIHRAVTHPSFNEYIQSVMK